jgi:hypothetical protein
VLRQRYLVPLFGAFFACVLESVSVAPQEAEGTLEFRCLEESKKQLKREAVKIGGEIKAPKKLVDAGMEFPEFGSKRRVKVTTWVGEALVGTDGLVVDAWAIRELSFTPPFPEYNDAILKMIRKWEYEPLLVERQRTPFCIVVTVNINVS